MTRESFGCSFQKGLFLLYRGRKNIGSSRRKSSLEEKGECYTTSVVFLIPAPALLNYWLRNAEYDELARFFLQAA